MTENKATTGMRNAVGIRRMCTDTRLKRKPNTSMTTEAHNKMAAICGMNSGRVAASIGPGITLFNMSAPSNIMAGGEPGMPNVSSGTKAPPMQALFAVSAAISPSIEPSPNFSGSLLIFLAVS